MIIAANALQIGHLCRATGLVPSPNVKGIAQVIAGVTVAVTAYDRWTENAVEMHLWIGGQISPGFVRSSFEYPFLQAGKGLVIGIVAGNNAPMLDFNRRIGFKVTYRIKDGRAVGEDLVLHEMRKSECRWIRRVN